MSRALRFGLLGVSLLANIAAYAGSPQWLTRVAGEIEWVEVVAVASDVRSRDGATDASLVPGSRPAAREERLVVLTRSVSTTEASPQWTVFLLEAKTGKIVAQQETPLSVGVRFAGLTPTGNFALYDRQQVTLLAAGAGSEALKPLWTQRAAADLSAEQADPEQRPGLVHVQVMGDRIVLVRDDGRFAWLSSDDGNLESSGEIQGRPVSVLRGESHCVVMYQHAKGPAACVIDGRGDTRHFFVGDSLPIWLHTDADTILAAWPRHIAAWNLAGAALWEAMSPVALRASALTAGKELSQLGVFGLGPSGELATITNDSFSVHRVQSPPNSNLCWDRGRVIAGNAEAAILLSPDGDKVAARAPSSDGRILAVGFRAGSLVTVEEYDSAFRVVATEAHQPGNPPRGSREIGRHDQKARDAKFGEFALYVWGPDWLASWRWD